MDDSDNQDTKRTNGTPGLASLLFIISVMEPINFRRVNPSKEVRQKKKQAHLLFFCLCIVFSTFSLWQWSGKYLCSKAHFLSLLHLLCSLFPLLTHSLTHCRQGWGFHGNHFHSPSASKSRLLLNSHAAFFFFTFPPPSYLSSPNPLRWLLKKICHDRWYTSALEMWFKVTPLQLTSAAFKWSLTSSNDVCLCVEVAGEGKRGVLGGGDWQSGTQMWICRVVSVTSSSVLDGRCGLQTWKGRSVKFAP